MALISLKEGRREQALSLLHEGEAVLSKTPLLYGMFLCRKIDAFLLMHEFVQAKQTLKEAEEILERWNVGEQSKLAKEIKRMANKITITSV